MEILIHLFKNRAKNSTVQWDETSPRPYIRLNLIHAQKER